jgi:hypothetical protein
MLTCNKCCCYPPILYECVCEGAVFKCAIYSLGKHYQLVGQDANYIYPLQNRDPALKFFLHREQLQRDVGVRELCGRGECY